MRAAFRMDWPGFSLDVDLDLPDRGVTALFGPSGSGKTTCLRCVAGLERRSRGRLAVGEAVWQDSDSRVFVPPHKRPIGYVFQDANLFAHLSVLQNLRYGMKRIAAQARRIDFDQAVQLLGIEPLLERLPDRLSGGERQRVGIARALLTSPDLLLMDEPLAALDHKRRREIMPYLERLHAELDIPVLYVTHSPDEVARLADHLVLMEDGRAIASGPVADMLARTDLPIASGDDAAVVLAATVRRHDAAYGLLELRVDGGSLFLAHADQPAGKPLRLRVPARDVSLSLVRPTGSSVLNLLQARITAIAPTDNPAHRLVRLEVGRQALLARITAYSADQLGLHPGDMVWAQLKAVALLA